MCLSRKILLLLLCLSLLIPKIGEAGTKAAVIVGISDYPEASNIPDLQSAAQDAQNFSDYLNRHDYQAYTFLDFGQNERVLGQKTRERENGTEKGTRHCFAPRLRGWIDYTMSKTTHQPRKRGGNPYCLVLNNGRSPQ